MKTLLLPLLFLVVFGSAVSAKITLPSVFSDNMVLQQNTEVALWGWADAGETVKIIAGWNTKDTVKVKADNTAAWKTTLKTIGAGGPYTIMILGVNTVELKNVILSSKNVKNPAAVRFCFDDTSMPDIFSNEGLPLAPFRTDNWEK
jgi:sialate O-acetylesterase